MVRVYVVVTVGAKLVFGDALNVVPFQLYVTVPEVPEVVTKGPGLNGCPRHFETSGPAYTEHCE
jgi:hypothetical protein